MVEGFSLRNKIPLEEDPPRSRITGASFPHLVFLSHKHCQCSISEREYQKQLEFVPEHHASPFFSLERLGSRASLESVVMLFRCYGDNVDA
ncbi:hypothetical protein C5167_042363 [Papaver somniferum]|uniref:Uncharacterized protein n=1 Tax=Papaver somniferum TaxID=3469 RepID=A0A4Y7L685_PAPSO|nr:hypothetical protein C5167_042363 [Papaver somniferum]